MHCKSLWIKASAKCIHINVNVRLHCKVIQFVVDSEHVISLSQQSCNGFNSAKYLITGSKGQAVLIILLCKMTEIFFICNYKNTHLSNT